MLNKSPSSIGKVGKKDNEIQIATSILDAYINSVNIQVKALEAEILIVE